MARTAFVIMQIGNDELDRIYEDVVIPATRTVELEARRIDRDNEGGLLKAEIMTMIDTADILIADLTNERPNCYLEVGYAMGLGRNRNLILTVRRDHLPGEPGHVVDGPKVHFDIAGYDLLLWDHDDLEAFREELTRRLQRRLALTRGGLPSERIGFTSGEPGWPGTLRSQGRDRLAALELPGALEVEATLVEPIRATQRELLEAARESNIDTFGWPLAPVIDRDELRPRPTGSGIRAELEWRPSSGRELSYDLWELGTDGRFFTIISLFEDGRGRSGELYFNTRIVRIAEVFLFLGRLYGRLESEANDVVSLLVQHSGLSGRELSSSSNRRVHPGQRSAIDESTVELEFRLGQIESELVDLVKRIAVPLFELFDFCIFADEVYEDIVNRFVAGEVT